MLQPRKMRYDKAGPVGAENLKKRHFDAYYCSTREEGVAKVLELILGSFLPSSPHRQFISECYQPCTHKILTFPTLVSSVAVSPIQAPAQTPAISAAAPRIHFPLCRQGQLSKIHT